MSTYQSDESPKSSITKNIYAKRLSSLFGYNAVNKSKATNDFERNTGLRFVKVDLNNDAYRFKQASLGSVFKSNKLNTTLQKYFDAYMDETMQSYSDIAERQDRLNELTSMAANDSFVSRCINLFAFEATQIDEQNRLISCESPSVAFVNKVYELFARWGITQQRVHAACKSIEMYGEAVWTHRISEKGVEKVIPLLVNDLVERLEFNTARMAEYIAQTQGRAQFNKNRRSKIDQLVDMLTQESKDDQNNLYDINENFTDLFDTKLLGFEFQDGIVVPPWLVTHFRYESDASAFFPYGTPPLIHCLAPFKQAYSTMILQGLARSMSFPITIYSVKGTESMTPFTAFNQTNTIREEYENIGVTPQSNSLEVYTLNTKIWIPDGLLTVDVKSSKVDMDFVGDLEIYMDRVAVAAGVPKGYLDQEFGGFGNSAISLVEQYKPFARQVYTIQSCFLEGLSDLIRLHFAITGEFDYNIPFILNMRFPADEMGDDRRNAKSSSIDLANSVMDLISKTLGLEEGESLPEDIVLDILSRYTFLDETALQKWMKHKSTIDLSKIMKSNDEDNENDDDDDADFDMGQDFNMESNDNAAFAEEPTSDEANQQEAPIMESFNKAYYLKTKKALNEKRRKKLIREAHLKEQGKQLREKRIKEQYKSSKTDIYFTWLKENSMQEWRDSKGHQLYAKQINENHLMYESFKILSNKKDSKKLKETKINMKKDGNKDVIKDLINTYKSPNDDILLHDILQEKVYVE